MAVNLISSEDISIQQTGSDIDLHLTGKTGDLVVDSIRTKNMFNIEGITKGYVIGSTGAISSSSGFCYSEFIPVKPSTQYTISRTFSGATGAEDLMRVAYYQSNKTFIDRPNSADRPWTITTPNNCYYIRLSYQYEYSGNASNTNIQVEEGSAKTSYSPYQDLNPYQNIYSTNETRIGTWIDGKPLYRQVLEADNPTHGGYPFGTLSISVSQVKRIEAVCRISSGGMICMGYNQFFVQVDSANKLYYSNQNYTGTKLIVIIEYTKTTD